ncbi:hypothetical protein [Salinibacter sp.]|uniref:hypothetical protein n=1 Tax=Salinibacter sp. TaxID=2065818 RepID=UPI0021E6F63F|nr:hypothetical protein [Salinibacter sp.]
MGTVRLRSTLGWVLCLMWVVGPAWAQQQGAGGMQAGGTAYYTFARPGQNTIEVLVLGGGRSGVYEIGDNVSLGKLMALAGGGGGGGRTKVTVHHFRLKNGNRTKILEERLDDFAERPQYPSLRDGDVIRIESNQTIGWRDGLRIATTALSLTLTLLTLFDVNVR